MTDIRDKKGKLVQDKRTAQGVNQNRNPGLFPQQTKKQIGQRGTQLKRQAERTLRPTETYAAEKRNYGRARGADIPVQRPPRKPKPPLNTTQRANKAANPGMFPTARKGGK